ncbi:hypothetical protein D918_02191 [Trichuris suis]|nr:hypothetical protein D918_02191 [Trichuris suis]
MEAQERYANYMDRRVVNEYMQRSQANSLTSVLADYALDKRVYGNTSRTNSYRLNQVLSEKLGTPSNFSVQNRRNYIKSIARELLQSKKQLDTEDEAYGWHYFHKALEKATKMIEMSAKSKRPIKIPAWYYELMQTARTLVSKSMNSSNRSAFRFLSPEFLSIYADQNNLDSILSPDFFSLHDGDEPNNILPLPRLLRHFPANDAQALMELILEFSGAGEILMRGNPVTYQKSMNFLETVEIQSESVGQYLLEKSKDKTKADHINTSFKKFERSLLPQQREDIENKGYSYLNKQQMNFLYGKNNPFNVTKVPFDKEKFLSLSPEERDRALIEHIESIATTRKADYTRTKRQIVLAPQLLQKLNLVPATLSQAVVLSPLVLSTIVLSPAVLGPLILSPLVLTPLVLGPRVLSPFVLSPSVMFPVILSPLVLHPMILSPLVLDPVVLSPFVLSPLILSPSVLSPFILSPLVLSPFIRSPGHLEALVLSPRVLSPLVKSKVSRFAIVMSPALLSRKKRQSNSYIETGMKSNTTILSPDAFKSNLIERF